MTTVASLVAEAARRFSSATAVVDGGRSLTFSEMDQRSNRIANALIGLGDGPSGRVALLMNNCLEYVECDFGIAKAGKVRIGINPRLVAEERLHVLTDSGAETLIYTEQFEEFVHDDAAKIPSLRNLVKVEDPGPGTNSYASLLTGSPLAPTVSIAESDPNYIMYTSGTSGRAKGATATNASRVAGTVNMLLDELDVNPGDAMLHVGSMCHGSGSKVLAYFIRGARNITWPRFDAEQFFDVVKEHGVTGTFVVPTMIGMLLEATSDATHVEVGRLKSVTYGGAPITPTRIEAALERFGDIFVQVYGSSEAPHPVMVLDRDDHARLVKDGGGERLSTVGRPATLVDVRLVDESGVDVGAGEKGELWVRGPNVMSGYWKNAEATADVFDNGWYKTGDIAVRDDQGYYFIVDRVRDVVISGGLNVYPAEVEAAIGRHPAVLDVAVIGVPDERWGESVKAVVILREGTTLDERGLLEHCAEHLAGYKKPRSVDFVESLPVGSTGKILKRELRDRYWAGRTRGVN